jgi:hypothetical protein
LTASDLDFSAVIVGAADAVAFVRRGLQKRLFHKLSTAPVSSNEILYERTSLSG